MAQVRLTGVGFGFSELVPLFAEVEFDLLRGFSALVGGNGAGKTTLLRLITGELRPDVGTVRVDGHVVLCAQEVARVDASIDALAASDDGLSRELRGRLSLHPLELKRWVTLSPGERKRWQIGAALFAEPDVLLLDEPTNHVDAEARGLLVDALARFDGIGVIVSHDRPFLDALVHTILRIDRGTVRAWPAPFAVARVGWETELNAERNVYELARERERANKRALAAVRRTHQAAEHNRSAAARMRDKNDSDARSVMGDYRAARAEKHLGRAVAAARGKVERVEVPSKPKSELGAEFFVGFERSPHPVMATIDGSIEVGGRVLLQDVRLTVGREDRLRIVGPNGAGKTTLLRTIVAASRARVGFLPQELGPDEIVAALLRVRELDPASRGRVLSLVANLGVDPSRLLSSQRPSPGEARKLHLAMLLGTRVQALVLDEPTNHLDIPSIERLERAIEHYPGTLVLVTHDDHFAARCTHGLVLVSSGTVSCGGSG